MYLILASWALVMIGLLGQQPAAAAGQATGKGELNYEVFKDKIQPIFLKANRGGPGGTHARCVTCHSRGTGFRLEPLSPGATTWNEEQSKKNFEAAKRMAQAGNAKSRILIHPLAESAGGDFFHNGGKHWESQTDPEFQTMKSWVMGETKSGQ